MAAFKQFLPQQCHVIRDGRLVTIVASELVVGDIIQISSGQKIPADLRVLSSASFRVDNSCLTGESKAVHRSPANKELQAIEATNICFYGTLCVAGSATCVVVLIGDNTMMGSIAQLMVRTKAVKTPIAVSFRMTSALPCPLRPNCFILFALLLRVVF